MPRYKVVLRKPRPISKNPFNPLRISLTDEVSVDLREWEMDADNEDEIRDFLRQSKEQDHPNTRGFSLKSIEIIT